MRKAAWLLGFTALVAMALVQGPIAASDTPAQKTTQKATVAKLDPTKVPSGKTYALLDKDGKTVKKFKSGTKTTMAVADCVQVDCPDSFERDVVCWKCKERLKANE